MFSSFPLTLALLTLGAGEPHATLAAAAGGTPITVTWRSGAAVLSHWQTADASGAEELRSAVGPMTAVRVRVESMGENRLYAYDHLELRLARGYAFDIDAWLDASGQRGSLPHHDAATDAEKAARPPRGFSVDDWWPATGVVALSVETEGCDVVPAVCELRTERILVHPPDAWRPWLDRALTGHGVLRDHLAGRVAGVPEPDQARLFGAILEGRVGERALVVGRLTAGPRVVTTGIEDRPRVEVCVRVARVLRAPFQGLDAPDGVDCFHWRVPPGFSEAAPGKTLPWLRGPGTRLLVAAGDVVERERPAAALRLTRRAAAMLDAVYPPP